MSGEIIHFDQARARLRRVPKIEDCQHHMQPGRHVSTKHIALLIFAAVAVWAIISLTKPFGEWIDCLPPATILCGK